MSYTEYMRRKAAAAPVVINNQKVRTASEVTQERRLMSSVFFPVDGHAVGTTKGDLLLTETAVNQQQPVANKKNTGRPKNASEYTAYLGSLTVQSNAEIFPSAGKTTVAPCGVSGSCVPANPVPASSGSDFIRQKLAKQQACGEKHIASELGPSVFKDDTISRPHFNKQYLSGAKTCEPNDMFPKVEHVHSVTVPRQAWSARPTKSKIPVFNTPSMDYPVSNVLTTPKYYLQYTSTINPTFSGTTLTNSSGIQTGATAASPVISLASNTLLFSTTLAQLPSSQIYTYGVYGFTNFGLNMGAYFQPCYIDVAYNGNLTINGSSFTATGLPSTLSINDTFGYLISSTSAYVVVNGVNYQIKQSGVPYVPGGGNVGICTNGNGAIGQFASSAITSISIAGTESSYIATVILSSSIGNLSTGSNVIINSNQTSSLGFSSGVYAIATGSNSNTNTFTISLTGAYTSGLVVLDSGATVQSIVASSADDTKFNNFSIQVQPLATPSSLPNCFTGKNTVGVFSRGGVIPSKHLKYVEKHHGNDSIVNGPKPVPGKYHIPSGTPAHLKINDPNLVKTPNM